MDRVDVNCLLGHWPFRRIYKSTFEDLRKVHKQNSISYGYVASLDSIFYNDPFEGDEELHELIKGSEYKHILTVNPQLPCFADDIKKGIELFDIRGVRIYPGYHGYTLEDSKLEHLCTLLRALDLPLFLILRMEDERCNYIVTPAPLAIKNVGDFIENHRGNKILLVNIRPSELMTIKDSINSCPNVYFETSGMKEQLFIVEKLLQTFDAGKMMYGSLHPLYCLKSTLLLVEKAEADQQVKDRILGLNSKIFC